VYSPTVSKGLWTILTMGFLTIALLIVGMMMSLMQFQKVPAVKLVKLAEQVQQEFKFDNVGADVRTEPKPGTLRITYLSRVDTKFDSTLQNQEMKKVAEFAIKKYEGVDRPMLADIQVTRSETHGSGCFQTTYVGNFTLLNPFKGRSGLPFAPPPSTGSSLIPPPEK